MEERGISGSGFRDHGNQPSRCVYLGLLMQTKDRVYDDSIRGIQFYETVPPFV